MQFVYLDSRFTLRASFPRSVALTQLRFACLAVASSAGDLHPEDRAHAGRHKKKPFTQKGSDCVAVGAVWSEPFSAEFAITGTFSAKSPTSYRHGLRLPGTHTRRILRKRAWITARLPTKQQRIEMARSANFWPSVRNTRVILPPVPRSSDPPREDDGLFWCRRPSMLIQKQVVGIRVMARGRRGERAINEGVGLLAKHGTAPTCVSSKPDLTVTGAVRHAGL
jgi:hypothetical protein